MAGPFAIEFSVASKEDYEKLRAFERRRVLAEIEKKLSRGATTESANVKCLGFEPANFTYVLPLWELTIGAFRVFYEVDESENVVYIHAVRRKPPHKTTSQVLNETTLD
jgi:mRNA-degrading endonuclease RelE of RelBE toxin-antitoxin system